MGMYDTLNFNCPNCGEEGQYQTKLGECCLDYWNLTDETTMDRGYYILKDECSKCKIYPTVHINTHHIFDAVLISPPEYAQQEGIWGSLHPRGTDVKKLFDVEVKKLKKLIEEIEDEKD